MQEAEEWRYRVRWMFEVMMTDTKTWPEKRTGEEKKEPRQLKRRKKRTEKNQEFALNGIW